jgi:mannose-6-phosphate isomerase-like protein (cupin superfamily)
MVEEPYFEESISSLRTLSLFIALAPVFFVLSAWRMSTRGFGLLSIILLVLGTAFVFYGFNHRTLRICMNREALVLGYGIFSRIVRWHEVDHAHIDGTPLTRIGGAGVHFTFIARKYSMYFNFLEYPRVVPVLKKTGIVREVIFTTRHPDDALAAVKRLEDRGAPPFRSSNSRPSAQMASRAALASQQYHGSSVGPRRAREMTMKIRRESVPPFDFEGLEIRDFTAQLDTSSSFAEIIVPAGARHARARSKRSDKYYYVLEGILQFTVQDRVVELGNGDLCIIRKGDRFSYENPSEEVAKVLLVHTPNFDLSQEVFED